MSSDLYAARAPITIDELKRYCGVMFNEDHLESLRRSGEIKPLDEVPNTYWRVPPALRKRTTMSKCHSPLKETDRTKLVEAVSGLRAKVISMSSELDALRLRKDDMPTQDQLKEHMERLHLYNERKDIGQSLLGHLAELEREKLERLYEKYSLEVDD